MLALVVVVALVFASLLAVGVRAFSPRRVASVQRGRQCEGELQQVVSTRLCAVASGKGKAGCKLCAGQGGIACVPCRGTGVDRKGGDIFQRYMCKSCKGFGLVGCSCTGGRGLTPEQTGER